MKKIIKNPLFTFILGALIFGGIGTVYALVINANEITYNNSKSNSNVTTVQGALEEIYDSASLNKFCEYKDNTYSKDNTNKLSVGTMYECTVGYDNNNAIKHNFYILAANNDKTIDMIMQHNLTEGTSTTTMTWMDAMGFFDDSNIANGIGTTAKSNWTNVLNINLPTAQAIANAVGNTSWKVENNTNTGWFCFGTGYDQTCNGNSGALKNDSQTIKNRWLFNYTRECSNSGCNQSLDNINENNVYEAYGYWTRDLVKNYLKDDTSYAWFVGRYGLLGNGTVSGADSRGVRPVITVYKNNLYSVYQ